jgi:hypothetical protein
MPSGSSRRGRSAWYACFAWPRRHPRATAPTQAETEGGVPPTSAPTPDVPKFPRPPAHLTEARLFELPPALREELTGLLLLQVPPDVPQRSELRLCCRRARHLGSSEGEGERSEARRFVRGGCVLAPFALDAPDLLEPARTIVLGMSPRTRLLFVVTLVLEPEDVVRIISARKASPSQRRKYEEAP